MRDKYFGQNSGVQALVHTPRVLHMFGEVLFVGQIC